MRGKREQTNKVQEGMGKKKQKKSFSGAILPLLPQGKRGNDVLSLFGGGGGLFRKKSATLEVRSENWKRPRGD